VRNKNNLQGVRSIVSQICSRIPRIMHSRKTISSGFALSVVLIQLCGGCKDTSKSEYFVQTIGICHKKTSIKIIDESNRIVTAGRFNSTSQNPYFKNYVNTISRYVFAKIDKMGQCQDNPQVELTFVYRPLISQRIAPFNFEQTKSDKTQYLDSPWAKLTIDKTANPLVSAAFIWNERQFLFDQALLSGARSDPSKPLLPIDRDIFWQFIEDYKKSVVIASQRAAFAENGVDNASRRLKKSRAIALSQISQRLPADVIWLSGHMGLGSEFPGDNAMDGTIKQGTTAYINLTKILLDRRFSSVQPDQHYQSIFDLKDIFNIQKYRINKLY
jgi:hypothetical protein